ncbi:bifunctional cytidylyltransferase/SDR family oxidoreductase [Streptomyces xanthochromogenes]|uniref:bifunctional cytidylyltransferase/SDR family oxidoreductase n=1 Tax=Streptomyces xanthochromogenes TaxID=67384 RepID=UPI0034215803
MLTTTNEAARDHTVAVVLAGGTGSRIGLDIPKQLIKIAGRTIIEHTLRVFEESDDVDEIAVFMHPDHLDEVRRIADAAGLKKVAGIHSGGKTRTETSRRAIALLSERVADGEELNILMHDAVRPLLSQRVVRECVAALAHHSAVDVAIPTSDTIVVTNTREDSARTDAEEHVTHIPTRANLRRGQTPQAFKLSVLRAAYKLAEQDEHFTATDDCSVVLRYLPGIRIQVVPGDEHNMKVTHPVDLFLADKLFQLQSRTAPAHRRAAEYRERLDGKVMVVFGASYGIGAQLSAVAERHGCRVFGFSRTLTGTHVEEPHQVAGALRRVHAQTGRIDFIVNTAGILRTGALADTTPSAIDQSMAVNLLAPIYIARAGYPYLADSQGQLLLYTSSSYTRGRRHYSLYSAAKAATVNLTQALADEWAQAGVRVNCINPERTRTPMRTNAFGEEPEGTLLTAATVARTSLDVLLSPMTGHVVDVRLQDPALNPADARDRSARASGGVQPSGGALAKSAVGGGGV